MLLQVKVTALVRKKITITDFVVQGVVELNNMVVELEERDSELPRKQS